MRIKYHSYWGPMETGLTFLIDKVLPSIHYLLLI